MNSSPEESEQPSASALFAAAARAAHLVVDEPPVIFRDTAAAGLLGDRADELIGYHRAHGSHPVLAGARVQVLARARYTEDHVTATRPAQYVVLGAGLDTFALRGGVEGTAVFEVDHPATQAWKLSRPGVPGGAATYVPVDLAADPLLDRLVDAGFDPGVPAVVSWLGVTMYLTRDAVERALADLGRLAPGTELIFDHVLPDHLRDDEGRAYATAVAAATAENGEPWRTTLTPEEAGALAATHGFPEVRHLHLADAVPARLWDRADALRPSELLVLTHAVRRG
ncbi:SAM-dependent methyltransferase [Actinokineospora auranticolor]|uniref:S-adenosyl-L-methionine-dependent methyltransferase n=1 Tax=Actinokineospora auranticolor TaxID=155976 RepID=A0A2S6GCQ2_9PSEU|nr:SAM-dependent methyltransferase [Actinokineospora auranticolor]PPK62584.1 methyltransferase (TIGR00027 family) [Actinokineospora auranticolor]